MNNGRKILLLAFACASLAGFPGQGARASAGLWDPAISICDISARDSPMLIRGFLTLNAYGHVLNDADCPDKSFVIPDAAVLYRFMKEVDSTGVRFGDPPGPGAWTEIQLRGSISATSGRLAFSEVVRYERHTVVDSRWASGASEFGPGPVERSFDAQLTEGPQPRRIEGRGFLLLADGTLSDQDVAALLSLAAPPDPEAISICRLTPAQTYVRVLCHWQGAGWTDVASWTYARDRKSWKCMKRMNGVVR